MSDQAADRATHTKNCQDPTCASDYAVVQVNVETGEADFLCLTHCALMWVAIAAELDKEIRAADTSVTSEGVATPHT